MNVINVMNVMNVINLGHKSIFKKGKIYIINPLFHYAFVS